MLTGWLLHFLLDLHRRQAKRPNDHFMSFLIPLLGAGLGRHKIEAAFGIAQLPTDLLGLVVGVGGLDPNPTVEILK